MIAFHSPGGLRRKLEQNSYVLRLRKRKKKILVSSFFLRLRKYTLPICRIVTVILYCILIFKFIKFDIYILIVVR